MTPEDQSEQLERCVRAFVGSVAALDEHLFLRKVTTWTARDMVAHLIGWNRYVVRGAREILRAVSQMCTLPQHRSDLVFLVRETECHSEQVML